MQLCSSLSSSLAVNCERSIIFLHHARRNDENVMKIDDESSTIALFDSRGSGISLYDGDDVKHVT